MTFTSFEPLESRRLMAGTNNYLDAAWAGSGVSTLAFRTFGSDANITNTQVVYAANGSTYVMARTKTTVQVQQLAANGTANSSFGKNGILLAPLAGQTSSAKIATDSLGNLILLADNKIYRFDGQGKSLNANFATNGVLTLGDFTGQIDMDVDGANKIYVTGSTKNGKAMAVERFISRGRLDKTFNRTGVVAVPLPKNVAKLAGSNAQGRLVTVIADDTPDITDDNDIILAGDLTAPSYDGVQAARIKYDGTLASGYGTGGTTYLLGQKSNEATQNTVTLNGALSNGWVTFTATSVTNPGLDGTTKVYVGQFLENGVRNTLKALQATRSLAAPNDTYLLVGPGFLSRTVTDNATAFLSGPYNFLFDVQDIAAYGPADDDGLSILTASFASKAGRVNVARYLPTLVPDVA